MYKIFFIIFVYLIVLPEFNGEKIIINTDAGGDDAVAILLLLRYEASKPSRDFQVIAITCSYGNTNERQIEQNLLKILTIAGRTDIPIYAGATKGFLEPLPKTHFYGDDGLGDFAFDKKIQGSVDRSKHAAVALVDLVKANAGEVSIVSIGPITNIGLAIGLDANFTRCVKHFYLMAGSAYGIGNEQPNVEFNIDADPESALMLFNAALPGQVIMLPLEIANANALRKSWRIELGKMKSPIIEFLNKAENVELSIQSLSWNVPDATLAACIIGNTYGHLLNESDHWVNVDPVVDGKARGSLLVDSTHLTSKVRNTVLIDGIKEKTYQDIVINYLSCDNIPCEV